MNRRARTSAADEDYVESYVGFVDILGFGDLVRSADKSPELRLQIVEALSKVRQLPKSLPATKLRSQNFSDSLILSTERTPEGLWRLLLSLDALAWNLIQIGVLARGAVALGGIYHDEKIVFGVGVNEAYRLESAVAKFPRIILGRRVVQDANKFADLDEVWAVYRSSRLLRDSDGVTFIHYLNDVAAANLHPRTNIKPEEDAWGQAGRKVQQVIQAKIDETLDAPHIYEKLRWLGRYWNDTVAANTKDPAEAAFSPIILAGEEPRRPTLPFRTRL